MKVMAPERTPQPVAPFSSLIASVKLLKFVPPVAKVLLIVKVPPAAVMIGKDETNEMLSIAAGATPPDPSFFHVNITLIVLGALQLPMALADIDTVRVCVPVMVPALHALVTFTIGAACSAVPKDVEEATGVNEVGATLTTTASKKPLSPTTCQSKLNRMLVSPAGKVTSRQKWTTLAEVFV